MKVVIEPRRLSGCITAPLSKSEAHRMLICASLCDEPVKLFTGHDELSDDIIATIGCLRSLGASITFTEDGFLYIIPINRNNIPSSPALDCHESGSTLRFMLPVVSALCDSASFRGTGRLPERPVSELMGAMNSGGVVFSSSHLPFTTQGRLKGGLYELPGNISSQYISGLMLALPLLEGSSTIALISSLKSASYVDITLSCLAKFGVSIIHEGDIYEIPGSQPFISPGAVAVGGDWSGASFFLAAGALSGPVSVSGLNMNSAQGDKKVLDVLRSFGAKAEVNRNIITVSPAQDNQRRHIEIDIDQTPDLLPVLAVAASCSGCEVRFTNAARLRLKESDRIASTAAIVRSLGGFASEKPDELFVSGSVNLAGGLAEGFHDHRIVMAAAVAGVKCTGDVVITDAESTGKSYPKFFRDYKALGGLVNVL